MAAKKNRGIQTDRSHIRIAVAKDSVREVDRKVPTAHFRYSPYCLLNWHVLSKTEPGLNANFSLFGEISLIPILKNSDKLS
jgi:hypothetical protein